MNQNTAARILNRQLAMNAQTLAQLRKYGVTAHTKKRLEFSYGTSSAAKARALARVLVEYDGYDAHWGKDGKRFLVYGRSTNVVMSKRAIDAWVGHMCVLGAHHDAGFDGWGTSVTRRGR